MNASDLTELCVALQLDDINSPVVSMGRAIAWKRVELYLIRVCSGMSWTSFTICVYPLLPFLLHRKHNSLSLSRFHLLNSYRRYVRRGLVNWMENLLGLLRILVKRGVNLAVRDVRSSDPYVIVKMGKQKLKTRVIKKDVNPEWNEDLTLSVADPNLPIKLTVYDHDTFSMDDKMGDAEIDIKPFVEVLRMKLDNLPSGTILTRIQPCRSNCLAEESCVVWNDGKVMQDMCLRLRNVECGEVEIQLGWIELPGSREELCCEVQSNQNSERFGHLIRDKKMISCLPFLLLENPTFAIPNLHQFVHFKQYV
ncbi:unnamed protein product [Fraxinus pennsylvanica]|uniref:C2 domain-containing protein n=1 Tax=Fraxinus pennsylvanica TaxID=56036 RepID=A0AAD2A732_9LAMI|nr:unnamed protein product [Fraxinus pennsylvanica]